ncbi:MAG: hypothetical protein CL878_04830 [Dehalococcoidia bacterium]|nr:hypothetical protein [Dehalococcoidia bacterium]
MAAGRPAPTSPASPRRPQRIQAPAPGSGGLIVVLLATGIGLVALGQFYLQRFPDRIGTGLSFLALGVVAFAVALVLSSPAATNGVAHVASLAAGLFRQHPWRLSLVLLSVFLTWALLDSLRSLGRASAWSLFPLWMAACGSYLLAFIPWRWPGDEFAEWLGRYWFDLAVLGGLTLLATILRFMSLGTIPDIVDGDEGRVGIQALQALRGEINNPFVTTFGHSTFYLYLIGQGMNLFGINAVGLRVTSAVAGSLTIIFTYLLARNIGGLRAAVIAGAIMTVSHIHIHFSRVVMSGNIQDALFAVAVVYFLDLGLRRRGVGTLAFGGFLLGFFFYIYMGSRLIIVVIPVALTLYYVLRREELLADFPGLAITVGALLITAAPMGLWVFTHTDDFMARVNQTGIIQNGWLAGEVERQELPAWRVVLEQTQKAMLTLTYYPAKAFYNARLAMLDYFTAVAFLLGAVYAIARSARDRTLMLLVVWIVLGIVLGNALLLDPEEAAYRILIILPALAIVATLGIIKVWDVAASAGAPPVLLGVGSALWLAGVAFINLNYAFLEFPAECEYSDPATRLSDHIARYVSTQPIRTQTYLFGEPRVSYGTHPSVDLLRRGRPLSNAKQLPLSRAAVAPDDAPLLMLFVEEREAEYQEALSRFPGGRSIELRDCAAGTVRAYHVPLPAEPPSVAQSNQPSSRPDPGRAAQ